MIGDLIFLLSLTVAVVSQPDTLEKSKLPDCRRVVVQDSDRRSFDDRNSFKLDVDADGRPDTITPRTYTLKANRKDSGRLTPKAREIHWIAFDMKTSKGRVLKSFFKSMVRTVFDKKSQLAFSYMCLNLQLSGVGFDDNCR